jgi:hypothetical protein
MTYCQDCGAELGPRAQYCPECGAATGGPVDTGQRQSNDARPSRGDQRTVGTGPRENSQNGAAVTTRRGLIAAGGVVALGTGWFLLSGQGNPGGGSPPLDEVVVEFLDVRQPSIGATSATLPLVLTFRNPTQTAVPDISGDFDLLVSDQRIASDEIVVNRLEPGEETVVNADVIVQYADSGAALVNTIRSGQFGVELEMELNAGGATREFSLTGEV